MLRSSDPVASSSSAVHVRELSKKYLLYQSPKERLLESLHPFRKKFHREFWALQGIDLEVPKGETFGIIGQNGSGKSTLLEILADVLRPTAGEVKVQGKVSALLELGAGFHPEFTGRDNVLMKGLLMGLSRPEIRTLLPKIQDFADIGEFFDQPVKIYSSGMFVRLAFATGIHANPDVILLDEALGVGDAKFQHKCYQKLSDLQKEGKTILLVSHDMNVILNHCDRAILLEQGKIVKAGSPGDVVTSYYELLFTGSIRAQEVTKDSGAFHEGVLLNPRALQDFLAEAPISDQCARRRNYNRYEHRYGDRRAEIIDYLLVSQGEADAITILSGDWTDIYVKTHFHQNIESPMLGFSVKTLDGIIVYGTNSRYNQTAIRPIKGGETMVFKFSIKMDVTAGHFFIDLGVAEKNLDKDVPLDIRASLIHLVVEQKNRFDGFAELASHSEEITNA